MAYRDGPLTDLKVPLTWTAAAAVVVAVIIAAVLLMGDKRDALGDWQQTVEDEGWGPVRQTFDRGAAGAGAVLSVPVRGVGSGFSYIGDYFGAVSENRRLKRRLREMERWRVTAVALKDVNERYETILQLRTYPDVPMVSAHVVVDSRGPYNNARLANVGREKGVRIGHPVLSEHGLVGRVVGVAPNVSRVMMLTDPASKTPVLVDRTNARAILTGDGGPNPRLEFLRGVNPVKSGDPILTSGDGGVFPRGVPVGVAVKGLDGVWRARLYSDRAPIDYVRILLFQDFTQLADQQALSVTTVPSVAVGTVAPPAAGGVVPGAAAGAAGLGPPIPPGAAAAPGVPLVAPAPRPAAANVPRPPPARARTPTPQPVRPAAAPPARPAAAEPRPTPPPAATPAPATPTPGAAPG